MAKDILKEAIVDTKMIKEAAFKNAQSLLNEHLKKDIESLVENALNEEDDETMAETEVTKEAEDVDLDVGDDDDMPMDLEMDEEDEEDVEDEEEPVEEGYSQADLEEALLSALQEVDHGDLGEPEMVDPDTHDSGLLDQDMKEDGWETKKVPAAKDQYSAQGVKGESINISKKALVKLVSENKAYKKANAQLKEGLRETHLFNTKLNYAIKILQKEGLSNSIKKDLILQLESAETVKQVKGLYETIDNTLKIALRQMGGKAAKSKRSLSEALGSGTDKGVSAVDDSHLKGGDVLKESEDYRTRWAELAGIKKHE